MTRSASFIVRRLRRMSGIAHCLLALPVLAWPVSLEAQTLGPADGHDLPRTDIERVAVGGEAPLFTLDSFDRGAVSLADFRGGQNVILVFYRGHW